MQTKELILVAGATAFLLTPPAIATPIERTDFSDFSFSSEAIIEQIPEPESEQNSEQNSEQTIDYKLDQSNELDKPPQLGNSELEAVYFEEEYQSQTISEQLFIDEFIPEPESGLTFEYISESNPSEALNDELNSSDDHLNLDDDLNLDNHSHTNVENISPVPRLYGEPESEALLSPIADDDLERMTQAEWMELIWAEEEFSDGSAVGNSTTGHATNATTENATTGNLENSTNSVNPVDSENSAEPIATPAPLDPSPADTSLVYAPSSAPPSPPLSALSADTPSQTPIPPEMALEPTLNLDDLEDSLGQVTSVSQLSDVQPTDWSYEALRSLVERYGVIVGYPDGTFRGDRPLTRYEFAAGLNAALDRLTEMVLVPGLDNTVTQDDLLTLQRLQAEFAPELATLRGRVDSLEARVAELEAQQFSTTVVLNGQTTFVLADGWGGDPPGLGETNTIFANLTQLQLAGSFIGQDAFRINLSSGSFENNGFAAPDAFNTNMALLGVQSDTENEFNLDSVEYRVAVGDRLVVAVKPAGFSLSSILSPNSLYSSSSQGALSRFASENSVFKIGNLDAGVGADVLLTDRLRLQVAYGMRNPGDAEQGLFSSESRALGVQLLSRPLDNITTGISYINAFNDRGFLDTFTGSNNADTSGRFFEPESATIHAIGGTLQWQATPDVIFGAWGGVTLTDYLSVDAYALSTTYLFSLGFPDTFGREGDLFAVMVGQPFRLREGINILREDDGSGLHYEAFYRLRINDNIAIIPGVFVVTDPGHVPDNDTIVVGAIRTVFSF